MLSGFWGSLVQKKGRNFTRGCSTYRKGSHPSVGQALDILPSGRNFFLEGPLSPSQPTLWAPVAPAVVHARCAQQGWLYDSKAGAWGGSSACQNPKGRRCMLSSVERWPWLCGLLLEHTVQTAHPQQVTGSRCLQAGAKCMP